MSWHIACMIPPPGWYCTRESGHKGPCAALPVATVGAESSNLTQSFRVPASPLEIRVKKLTPSAILPTKAYQGDLGWDLYADENLHDMDLGWVVPPGGVCIIATGCAFQLPPGWGAYNRPRSSQGIANLDIYGGVIDNGYRGELRVTVHNSGPVPVFYNAGERVGQLVLTPCPDSTMLEVNYLDPSERGEKRFGSSGR